MKKIFFALVFSTIFMAGCAVFSGGKAVLDEVYEGTGLGRRGPIVVQVRLSGGSITEIIVVDSLEDRFVGGAAIDELIEQVIECNSTDVDVISGATESSRGFLEAVENAIMRL